MLFLFALFTLTTARSFLKAEEELLREARRRSTIEEHSIKIMKRLGITEPPQDSLSSQEKAEYLQMLEGHEDSEAEIHEKVITLMARYVNNEVSISLLPLYNESVTKVHVLSFESRMKDLDDQLLLKTMQQAAIDRDEAVVTEFVSPSLPSSFLVEVRARILTVHRKGRNPRALKPVTSSEACHMLSYTVHVKDIYMDDVILKPEVITLGECAGQCSLGDRNAPQWVRFARDMGLGEMKGCCSATEKHSIMITYRKNGKIVQTLFDDVIIGACGCNY